MKKITQEMIQWMKTSKTRFAEFLRKIYAEVNNGRPQDVQ